LTPHAYRAKLYFLNGDGKWLDVGTGYFRCLLDREETEYYMQIVSEENMQGNSIPFGETAADDDKNKIGSIEIEAD
jgi:hypothetical protein